MMLSILGQPPFAELDSHSVYPVCTEQPDVVGNYSEDIQIVLDANLEDIRGFRWNGEDFFIHPAVPDATTEQVDIYTADWTLAGKMTRGSVIVNLYAGYLDTLPNASYTVDIVCANGAVTSVTFALEREAVEVANPQEQATTPSLGDNSNTGLWVLMGSVAVLGLPVCCGGERGKLLSNGKKSALWMQSAFLVL